MTLSDLNQEIIKELDEWFLNNAITVSDIEGNVFLAIKHKQIVSFLSQAISKAAEATKKEITPAEDQVYVFSPDPTIQADYKQGFNQAIESIELRYKSFRGEGE